jgi:hypothetical protein
VLKGGSVICDDHTIAAPGTETVEGQHRLAIGAAIASQELDNKHSLTLEGRVLDGCRGGAEDFTDLHVGLPAFGPYAWERPEADWTRSVRAGVPTQSARTSEFSFAPE